MITDVKYLDFIYQSIKARVFNLYYTNNEKEFDDFIKFFNYFEVFFEQLKNDNNYKSMKKFLFFFIQQHYLVL